MSKIMDKEEKQLLLKDLCARLLYEVILLSPNNKITYQTDGNTAAELLIEEGWKPYLRPISSMTDDEMDRFFDILHIDKDGNDEDWIKINDVYGIKFFFPTGKWIEDVAEAYDYLYSIHIDFRGLIRKGLAIEAPEGMYNII